MPPARGPADLSRLHVLVPLRSLAGGKQRLGGALDAEERETLLRGLLRHTLTVLGGWDACAAIHLVASDASVLREAAPDAPATPTQVPVHRRLQAGEGLNEALLLARRDAIEAGATAVLCLPADLPVLSLRALERLLEAADAALAAGAGRAIVVIAPSDARVGTNALLLSPPQVIDPAFGTASLEAHLRAAAAVDASAQVVEDEDLGFDLDTPEDLERLDPAVLGRLVATGAEPLAAAPG
jgi:2-phospho-L-lactate guanylyltransferase